MHLRASQSRYRSDQCGFRPRATLTSVWENRTGPTESAILKEARYLQAGINLVCYQIQTYGSLPPKLQCPAPLYIHTKSRKSHRFFSSTGVRTGWSFLCFVKWVLSSFGFASAFHTQNRNSIFLLDYYSSHQNLYFGFSFALYSTLIIELETHSHIIITYDLCNVLIVSSVIEDIILEFHIK